MKAKSDPYLTLITIVFGLLLFNLYLEENLIRYLCLLLTGVGVFSLKFSKIIEIIWLKLAYLLSQVIPNILLTLIFYFMLTPIALLSKLFNAKSNFNSTNDKKSFFVNNPKKFNKDSFEKAW
jgi:hypothetical protein|tara:strand:- start:51 stop:416 length:366 start_codon:yes stop_codon:yes gene_type:complete